MHDHDHHDHAHDDGDDDGGLISIARRSDISRRDVLRLIAGGVAVASAGCLEGAGEREILPYVEEPPEAHPGVRVRYASAIPLGGLAIGVLAHTREGRPIKLEGNPHHPASRGATTPQLEARLYDLYDPQRSRAPRAHGATTDFPRVAAELARVAAAPPPGDVWIVASPQSSPTVAALLAALRDRMRARVIWDAPLGRAAAYRGVARALGAPLEPQLDLARADVVVALDADVLGAAAVPAWARAAATRRRPDGPMSRWWCAEPMPTPTGTFADMRLAIPAGDVAAVAVAILARLGERGRRTITLSPAVVQLARQRLGRGVAWVNACADDLADHAGRGAIAVGERQPELVHALGRWIDAACGNDAPGAPVSYREPALVDAAQGARLDDLAASLRAGQTGAVIVLDANPIATAPRALELRHLLPRAPWSLHVGAFFDETATCARIHVPLSHELEAWGDARAIDGTAAIVQPTIRPLYDSRSLVEVLAAMQGDPRSGLERVKDQWRGALGAPGLAAFDAAWSTVLATGVIDGTAAPARTATAAAIPPDAIAELERLLAPRPARALEVDLAPSPQVGDGRHANNPWLVELPHPITKQTWGNAALMSAALADELGARDGDLIAIAGAAGTIELPAIVVPGHADGAITVELGWGRFAPAIPVAYEIGVDGYPLRADAQAIVPARATRLPSTRMVIRTQLTFDQHDRELAPIYELARYQGDRELTRDLKKPLPSLNPKRRAIGPQWAMTIDNGLCTGCSACVVACQAENNWPTVGPSDVARGRHMQWLRIDSYVDELGRRVHQPMLCQHCEDAPCEYVCPVMATVHSPDGLNEMVYNRCVGTRFCSNNCPYKVRRFNWFSYDADTTAALAHNPDVTVRTRGVMEKCTYCVQRIRGAEIQARMEKREIRPGEVVTACQAACPMGAIQFGALQHDGTPMVVMRAEPRRYEALHDLGTRPRTQYLAKITNPKEGA